LFDFGLHFRFLQKATEALFEMGQASVAATLAWQKQLHEDFTSDAQLPANRPDAWKIGLERFSSSAVMPVWQLWFGCWMPPPVWTHESLAASRSAMEMAQRFLWPGGSATAPNGLFGWPNSAPPLLGSGTPWSFYQGPLTAMMLAYGIPYAVAAPTVRATTSALEAAEAAWAQWRLLVMIGNPTQGKWTISAQQPWPPSIH